MAFTLAGISVAGFLSVGSFASAGYDLVCEGKSIADFNRMSTYAGDTRQQEFENISWKAESSKWTVEEKDIVPIGEAVVDSRKQYFENFGSVSTVENESSDVEEAYDFVINGEKVAGVDNFDSSYRYHPDMRKLYFIKDLSEPQCDTVSSQTVVCKSKAELVECVLKKNGKDVEKQHVVKTETVTSVSEDVNFGEIDKGRDDAVYTFVDAPVMGKNTVDLQHFTYETDKKGYLAIKKQPLFIVVQNFGLNFKKDRKALAQNFGIKNYVGSYAQNMKIKKELLKLIVIK